MYTLRNVWDKFLSDENILLAIHTVAISDSSKNKSKRRKAKALDKRAKEIIPDVREYATHFYNIKHHPRKIIEHGKERTIVSPTLMEEYIHHMLIQCMQPLLKNIYPHSYCSIPGRGSHAAIKRIYRLVQKPKNYYCCQMDIHHFFESIPHDKLKERLDKVIHDFRFKKVLFTVLDAVLNGLPLGFFTSQWLTNWYLTPLDRYITEELKISDYTRYNDDMIIVGSNKRKLHEIRKKIEIFLKEKLGLEMKDNWQVYRIAYQDKKQKAEEGKKPKYKGRPIDVIGFKVYRDKLILRKRNMLKATRKAKSIYKKNKPTIYDCRQMMNYLANFKMTDTYNCFQKYIAPYISVKQLKKRISNYDKRRHKDGIKLQLCGINC